MIKKLAYSIGAVATALSYQAFSTYIIFFYVDVMKLPAFLAGVAMVIYAIWNAVNDPLAGYLSDRTRTRWGRRIPWIAGGAVPFGIVYYLLWVPPFQGVEQPFLLFLYFLFIICLFDGLYSFTILNWSSLYPEMYPGLEERAQVNSFRQSFGMIGLVIGISLPPLIYGRFGWPWMGALFGAITSAALLITLLGSFEKKQFSQDEPLGLLAALKATFKNRSFLSFVFANLLVQYTFTIILATIPFFAKYILGSDALQTSALLAAAFLTAIPMLFVWRMLTVKFGAKYCFMASMLVLAMALVPLLFAKLFIAVLITAAFIGSGLAGFILVADLIISDIIDEDEVATGTRREGMFFGMSAFVARFAIALEAASMSSIFLLSGYNPFVFTQTGAFNLGLRLLIAGLPILAMALAFVIMLLYPLAGKKLEGMRVRLAEMHTRKGVI